MIYDFATTEARAAAGLIDPDAATLIHGLARWQRDGERRAEPSEAQLRALGLAERAERQAARA